MYRIFTQEIFPTEIRSTSQGFTYGMARYCMAGFSLLTPALVAFSPTLLMVLLIAWVWPPRSSACCGCPDPAPRPQRAGPGSSRPAPAAHGKVTLCFPSRFAS